jgi:glycerate 2-kinase
MNVVIALDSFKGSLAAAPACRIVATAFGQVLPGARLHCVPMADGGEGTAAALVGACGGRFVVRRGVSGPLPGQLLSARYGWLPAARTAVVEMAQASGLPRVPPDKRDPCRTTTRGTGELIAAALRRGAARLVLTLGGSATNDGGTGAAAALGWRFIDAAGRDLPDGGAALLRLARIVPPAEPLCRVPVQALCDVTNPLCGSRGAAAVYGPQKGATPDQVRDLDRALAVLGERIRADLGQDVADLPGAGAAGGFGAGAVAFLNARLVSGVDTVADLTGLDDLIREADWVVTGEGRFDEQSLQGKVVSGILRRAARGRPRVAVLAGSIALRRAAWQAAGIHDAESCAPDGMAVEEAIRRAAALLRLAAVRLAGRLPPS